jgi:hypothetical protein
MLDGTEEIMRIIRKEVNSMKIGIPFLAAALLVGGFVANSNADVVSKTESAPGSYCHLRFPAITEESLGTDHPVLKGSDAGDIIDFYGPCDENPIGPHQVATQMRDLAYRLQAAYTE